MYLKTELYELVKTDERIFDFIQEGSLDGLWYWDLENPENEWMNAKFWKVLGYNPDEMPHKSSAWQNIINQDDLKLANENFVKHCENTNYPYDQVVRYTHKDGSTKWIRCRGIAIRDANGKPIRMLGAHQDITEIKNSETALYETKKIAEESEEKYRALYDNAPLSYQSLDEDGCFIDVNPMWLKTLGYEREEVIGQWYGDFLHPDFVEHFKNNFPVFKKRGYISDVQFKLRRKDNTYIYVSFEGCIGYTPEGKFKQTYCVFKDITEQKTLENALIAAKEKAEESEKLLKSVIENAPDGVVIINMQGRFKYVSPNAMRLFGYNIDESIGHPGDEYTHPDDLPMVLKTMESILIDPDYKPKIEYRFKRKDGEYRWIETTFTNLLSDKVINGIVLNFTDITERKQIFDELLLAKEKAEESERILRNGLENSPIPTTIAGIDGALIYVNKLFTQTYGYTIQDIPILEKWYEQAYPDPHYRKTTVEEWNKEVELSIQNGTPTKIKEYQVTCKNGEIKTVAVSAYFEKEIVIGLFQDITERKKAESSLHQIEWMLSEKQVNNEISFLDYGDLTKLNRNGLILSSLGQHQLINISSEYLDLLETSSAVYEKNGDYAMGLFSSNWCKMMDNASRKLCNTDSNEEALQCGNWHCHESCWKDASLKAITTNEPADIECKGGIRLYAVPIHANGEVIGAINFGYGEPPKTEDELKNLSALYQIPLEELKKARDEYQVRPHFIIDLAKKRLHISAQFIGHLIERKLAEQAIFELKEFNESIVTNLNEGIILENDNGIIQFANPAMLRMLGYNEGELVGENWKCFVPDDQVEVVNNANKRREKGESDQYEMELQRKDGERIFVLVGGVPNINKGRYIGLLAAFTDITERKKAEEALMLNESRYRKAQEIGQVGNWEYCLQTSNLWGSEEAKRIYGFDLKSENFTVDEVESCIPDRKNVHQALINLIEKEAPYDLEFEIITKDRGESRFIHSQAILEKDDNGNPLKISGVIHDITDRKLAEQLLQEKSEEIAAQNEEMAVQNEELIQVNLELLEAKQKAEESEERFYLAMQASNDGLFDWNLETNEIYYSPAWKKMLGYEEYELPNDFSVWEKTTAPEDVKKSWELQQKLISKQIDRFVIEFKMKHKAGHWIDVLAQAEAVFNEKGKAVRMVGTHTDITERKQAEQALKDSEQRFRSLVNTINSGVAFYKVINEGKFGSDYIIQSFNEFALKHEGLKEEDVIGKNLQDIRPKIDDYGLIDTFREVWKTGKPALFPAKLYIDEKYSNYYENRVFKISTGEIVAVYDDVTERERANLALKDALEKAQESDRLKSAFLANMSHEIRTPMNGILGFADLLKKPDLTGDEQQKYIGIIEKSGARMLNIINDIVDISKIEAGLMELHINETNINDQIEYTYTFFKPEAEAKGLKLSFRNLLPDKASIIQTDREKLYAILTNLVKNAIKYTKEGSIEIGYGISETKHTTFLQFYVKDSGIGIPKDKQEGIFERFIQADIDDKMARQGAGLGLAISKAYIEMLGGKIWAESDSDGKTEGKGSTFYFTLPYNTELKKDTNLSENLFSEKNQTVKKLKILIAEDDDVSELLIENYIKIFGKEIYKARTGVEAVEICRNNPDLDLILMDIRMPEIGGYEATKQIREFNRDIIIIAQTAYGLSGDREKAIDAGCNDYIAKPIDKVKLQTMIQKYFGN